MAGAGVSRNRADNQTRHDQTTVFHRATRPAEGNSKMARLVGVDLPRDKRIEIALTYIYGIGRTRSQQLLAATGVDPNARVHTLGDEELVKLRDEIEANFKIEGDLRREVQADIRRKIEIGQYSAASG
jgi:small subunit ribosomal protein S13